MPSYLDLAVVGSMIFGTLALLVHAVRGGGLNGQASSLPVAAARAPRILDECNKSDT